MRKIGLMLALVIGSIFLYLVFASLTVNSAENKAKVTDHKITKEEIGKDFSCVMCDMEMKVSQSTPAVDYKGKTYYFCGAGEKKAFSKNPEKYIAEETSTDSSSLNYAEHKITDQELGKEATCPVTKENFKITKKTPAIDFQGKIYYFCCSGCIDKFMASQTGSDSLKVEPDSLHHNQSSGGAYKHKGCC